MKVKEREWDRLLHIKTSGRDDTKSTTYNYPYEPTPYCVLERLALSGYIQKKDVLLDYGCGKGRVDFFLSYQTRCKTVGVDYDDRFISIAVENKKNFITNLRNEFILSDAKEYELTDDITKIYFFNPFSIEILQKVIGKVKESYFRRQRNITLFFYYPSDEYISYLMVDDLLMFVDEIYCNDLFHNNDKRERITIFEIQ